MMSPKDQVWLESVLEDCFKGFFCPDQKVKSFSLLVTGMAKILKKDLNQAYQLWLKDPASEKLKNKFVSLNRNFFYLERFCEEKIKG